MNKWLMASASLLFLSSAPGVAMANDYYVNSVLGSDSNSGTSASTQWCPGLK